MKLVTTFKNLLNKKKEGKKNSNYMTLKESRNILKHNIQQMRYYENLKKKNTDPSNYITTMKDKNNIIEIEDCL